MGPHQNSLKVQVRSEVKHQDGVDLGVDAVVVSSLMEKKVHRATYASYNGSLS